MQKDDIACSDERSPSRLGRTKDVCADDPSVTLACVGLLTESAQLGDDDAQLGKGMLTGGLEIKHKLSARLHNGLASRVNSLDTVTPQQIK